MCLRTRPLTLRVLEAQVADHHIVRGDQVEVGNALGPDGTLMGRNADVFNWEAIGMLHPQRDTPWLFVKAQHRVLKGRPAPR